MTHPVLLAFLGVFFCACASPTAALVAQPETAWLVELESDLSIVPSVDPGFGPQRTGGGVLETGDRLLFELLFERGEEVAHHYLAFEVLGPDMVDGKRRYFEFTGEASKQRRADSEVRTVSLDGQSPLHRIGVQLFNVSGEELNQSEVSLAEYVGLGQLQACELMSAIDEETLAESGLDTERMESFLQSLRGLVALVGLAQGDDLLSDLMWDVIDKPSLFSVIASLGVAVSVSPRHDLALALDGDVEGLDVTGPLWIFPMTFSINGRLALQLDLVVTSPTPPWAMTSGIVAFRGQHPSKAISVRARLVGASSRR